MGNGQFGRPKKHLASLKASTLRARLAPVNDYLQSFCDNEKIDMWFLLGLIGKKYYQTPGSNYDYKKAKTFENIYDGIDPFEKNCLTPMQGIVQQPFM